MDFTLASLTGQSFERLVRALALPQFGAGTCVFSSGPDAGRDLTAEGQIGGYEAQGWDGYLVLQAKYRESAGARSDEEDIAWLKANLDTEKAAFLDPKSGRKKPDYYIIATNVVLSGADIKGKSGKIKKGGVSKIREVMDSWISEVGIKSYDIWPSDKIIDMLAGNADVRQTYAAWITPGDVLSEIFKHLKGVKPDFSEIMRRALLTSLRRKQFAELKDAGSVSDPDIRASQVFIDIPSDNNLYVDGIDHIDKGVVSKIVTKSRFQLDPSTAEDLGINVRNKVVLLGGPGQGKSTVSTFISQLFRANLLATDKSAMRDDAAKLVVPETLARAEQEDIPTAIPKRYPVFVSLPAFADKISQARASKEPIPSLLANVAAEIGELCDAEIDRSDLRAWLKLYPWIVILDGLDEVPPSGERTAIIEAINMFASEVAQISADVLFLLTTRPQGYNGDLSSEHWEHWELSELPSERALAYRCFREGAISRRCSKAR